MERNEFIISTRPQKEWGWLVSLDLFFTGAGAGAFVFALALGSLTHMLIGIILVFLGTLFLLADLTRPLNAWRVIMRPRTSWISRGALGIMAFFVLSSLYMITLWGGHKGWTVILGSPWATRPVWSIVLGAMSGCSALFVLIYPGLLLGSMRSIHFWKGAFLPLLFSMSGLLCGLGVICLIPFRWEQQIGSIHALENLSLGLIIVGFFLLLSLILLGKETNLESNGSTSQGSLRMYFMTGIVGVGVIFSLIILILVIGGIADTQLLPYAGILLTLGTLLLRYTILRAGRHEKPV